MSGSIKVSDLYSSGCSGLAITGTLDSSNTLTVQGSHVFGQGISGSVACYPPNILEKFTLGSGAAMNKDQFAVLAEGTSSLSRTFDKLADAKTYAKQLTQQVKGRVLVVKAVYAVSPKVDVEEEDL